MQLKDLVKPHIDAYNSLFDNDILNTIICNLEPLVIGDIKLVISELQLSMPYLTDVNVQGEDRRLLPRECRQRNLTYRSKASLKVCLYFKDELIAVERKNAGTFPIMVKSKYCHLNSEISVEPSFLENEAIRNIVTKKEAVNVKQKSSLRNYSLSEARQQLNLEALNHILLDEDEEETGGYFIVNGLEKIVRLHIVQRRNTVFAVFRQKTTNLLTKYMVSARCVGKDELGQVNFLHYCTDGDILLRCFWGKNELFIPAILILKCLINTTDEEIYAYFNSNKLNRVMAKFNLLNAYSKVECQHYLGTKFSTYIRGTPIEVANIFIKRVIIVHLDNYEDKFNFIIFAMKKLIGFVEDKVIADNQDLPCNHEILTVAQLFASLARDRLDEIHKGFRLGLCKEFKKMMANTIHQDPPQVSEGQKKYREYQEIEGCFIRLNDSQLLVVMNFFKKHEFTFGNKFEYFLSTGNFNNASSSDIMERSGWSVLAERINFYRYISHFRSVHRGAFFATLKTTSIRKLRPESWGFFCPVHTPDGSPCGLLTHLSASAYIVFDKVVLEDRVFYELGIMPLIRGVKFGTPVFFNGRVVGTASMPEFITEKLKNYRLENEINMEVVYSNSPKQYNAIYVYTDVSRLMRRVWNKLSQKEEWIGIMEQVHLDIRLRQKMHRSISNKNNTKEPESCENITNGNNAGVYANDRLGVDAESASDLETNVGEVYANALDSKYEEIDNTNILSLVASCTPLSDYNQSPRNMYQCQMAKQSMGIPYYNSHARSDVKSYNLNYLHKPVVKTKSYELVKNYPLGLNCIVAVLSYTAYDMEDALVINKSSMERGMFTGYLYKNEKVSLEKDAYFTYIPNVNTILNPGDILYSYATDTGVQNKTYKNTDVAVVDTVKVFTNDTQCCTMTLRVVRNPIIGDKFCSRHGQKGVCSMHWPAIDMPFSESGVVPDIIINPHAFPSRMTIGMLIESMAGKSGCLLGKEQDGTPFENVIYLDEDVDTDDTFVMHKRSTKSIGDELLDCGFNYYGNEPMYSGVTGNEFRTDIFIGVVFYQRLRHMVSDKFQVRTEGAVIGTTNQPIGGRKREGGVRFGEMERDALIGHGVSYTLQDRLLKCSDLTVFPYCTKCKSILFCVERQCECGGVEIKELEMPYVFKYLCSELLAMNIRVAIDVK